MKRLRIPMWSFGWWLIALQVSLSFGQLQTVSEAQFIQENYDKQEQLIPMRDGVRLFTSIYTPKDKSQKYPFMYNRTPYNVAPYGKDLFKTQLGPSEQFARAKFIFVYQDVRGRWRSEGEFINMRPELTGKPGKKQIDESTDTYDTIAWLLKNIPNHNGKTGMWGISYPGFYTAAGLVNAHPALVAASPQRRLPIGSGTISSITARSFCRTRSTSSRTLGIPVRSPQPKRDRTSITARPTAMTSFSTKSARSKMPT